jgi:hypothetical protein
VFGIIGAVLLVCQEPIMTWVNTNSDGIHLTYAAQYFYPAHMGSAPLYLLLGHVVLWIPVGTIYWRMALLSSVPTLVGCIFIYLIIRKQLHEHKGSRWYGLVGAVVYGGSALVFSQSVIIKYYTLTTLFGIIAYWFCLSKRWWQAAVCLGCGIATHEIILFMLIPMFIGFRGLRSWKCIGIMVSFVLFYLYIPIANRAPYMWDLPNIYGVLGFIQSTITTGSALTGNLPIFDLPKRILDTLGILVVSFGLGVVGIVVAIWKRKSGSKWYRNVMLWVMILSVGYFVTDLGPQTYVYMVPAVAFGSMLVGIGLSKMRKEWLFATGGIAVVMLGFNTNYFDIGRTLDANLSAKEFFYTELNKVPNGQVLLDQNSWEWACVYMYNKEFGRSIIPVYVGTLQSRDYRKLSVDPYGIKYVVPESDQSPNVYHPDAQEQIALSIVESNENVWTSEATSPETYGAEIIKASGNQEVINQISGYIARLNTPTQKAATWQWKPSNPYSFITGSIEVTQWQFLALSNYSCMMFTVLGGMGYVLVWIIWKVVFEKKKWSIKNVKDKTKEIG